MPLCEESDRLHPAEFAATELIDDELHGTRPFGLADRVEQLRQFGLTHDHLDVLLFFLHGYPRFATAQRFASRSSSALDLSAHAPQTWIRPAAASRKR